MLLLRYGKKRKKKMLRTTLTMWIENFRIRHENYSMEFQSFLDYFETLNSLLSLHAVY